MATNNGDKIEVKDKVDFKFRKVTILEEVLGRGAYGVVYKAKCDELLCAAKYMHSIFFVENEGQHFNDTVANQFRKECELLSNLKHPNIVQYLGTHEEEGINTVILLMEKLDSSLHAYLQEHKASPLPFYQEVNISRDVACALDFLHVNGIHHRDLSCKNILLLGNLRAKVSDFGQSKLRNPKCGYSSNSLCPGNILYMPPETLKIPPEFAETLDEFSLGVVMIQIMNRQEDPRPTDLQCASSTPGMFYYVEETERRKNDIELCDPANPLLSLAISCISNNPSERAPIKKVCEMLTLLQGTSPYTNSMKGLTEEQAKQLEAEKKCDDSFILIDLKHEDSYYTKMIDALKRDNNEKDNLLKDKIELLKIRDHQLLEKHKQIEENDIKLKDYEEDLQEKERRHLEEITTKNTELVDKDQQLNELVELLSQKEIAFLQKEEELADVKDQLHKKDQLMKDQQTSSDERYSKIVAELEILRAELASKENFFDYVPKHSSNDGLANISPRLRPKDFRSQSQSTIKIAQPSTSQLLSQSTTQLPSTSRDRFQTASTQLPSPVTSTSRELSRTFSREVEQMDLNWQNKKHAPVQFQPQNSMAVGHEDKVYVSYCNYSRKEGKIYEYDLSTDKWKLLPIVNKSEFSLAIVHNNVVAIGGSVSLRKSGSILCLNRDNKWINRYNDVPTPRSFPTCVVVNNRFLMVVGGEVNGEPVNVVEVLDIQYNKWHYVRSLPVKYLSRMTASAKGSLVYLMGGFEEGALSKRAFSVDVHELVIEIERRTGRNLWKELPLLPVSGATATSFQNRLLAVGGFDNVTKSSSFFIYELDCVQNKWKGVGYLPRSFSRGLVALTRLNDREALVVVGGNEKDGVSTVTNVAMI